MNFNELIKTNKNNIKNIVKLITRSENEDVEQEVYIKLWKNADKYKEQGSFSSWITTVAKNVSKDYLKSAYRKKQDITTNDENVLVIIQDKKFSPEKKLIQTERQKQIIKAINELRPKFKEVILLCEIEGLSYEECSKKLKCPLGTIKSRLYNAKKELAEKLKDLM